MAFPHPNSRNDHDRKGDIPNHGSVVRQLLEWTIDITDYRNAKDDVNPAKNRTLGGISHDWFVVEKTQTMIADPYTKAQLPASNTGAAHAI
jgi:hypothetical protein